MEVLCKRLLSATRLLPCAWEEMRVRRKSAQQIPARNAKNDSQKPCQRKGREEAELSKHNPGGTKLLSSGCKEGVLVFFCFLVVVVFFELKLKRLGPSRKRLSPWRQRDPREKLSLVLEVESSQFQEKKKPEVASRTSRYQLTGRKRERAWVKTRMFHTPAWAQLPSTSEASVTPRSSLTVMKIDCTCEQPPNLWFCNRYCLKKRGWSWKEGGTQP